MIKFISTAFWFGRLLAGAALLFTSWSIPGPASAQDVLIELGARRELFIDRYLIDKLDNTALHLHEPRAEGVVLKFDQPWEGLHSGYCTMIRDRSQFRVYYRGLPVTVRDGTPNEVTCVAESEDGSHGTKPTQLISTGSLQCTKPILAGCGAAQGILLVPVDQANGVIVRQVVA